MNPSSFRMRTISTLMLLRGNTTFACPAAWAFRMRVRRSAIGSVIDMGTLPGLLQMAAAPWVRWGRTPPRGSLSEGHSEVGEQCPSFLVVVGRRDERDVHPDDLVDLVVVDLGEDDLLG